MPFGRAVVEMKWSFGAVCDSLSVLVHVWARHDRRIAKIPIPVPGQSLMTLSCFASKTRGPWPAECYPETEFLTVQAEIIRVVLLSLISQLALCNAEGDLLEAFSLKE